MGLFDKLKKKKEKEADTPIPDANEIDDCVRAYGRAKAKNLKAMADYKIEGGAF